MTYKCRIVFFADFHTDEINVVEEEAAALPPLLQEEENAEKLLRKPTKFEIMRRFKSKKTKRKSQIMHPSHLTEVSSDEFPDSPYYTNTLLSKQVMRINKIIKVTHVQRSYPNKMRSTATFVVEDTRIFHEEDVLLLKKESKQKTLK